MRDSKIFGLAGKVCLGTNTLAYFGSSSVTRKKNYEF
jgi:hypothetical protein